ncbi:hypothetical protein BD779DRAFT_1678286 [Infundibulicybe gibba]|nr:hypothetical protein BD779DRAFT_1678286 [Infundibulicybe gibba]
MTTGSPGSLFLRPEHEVLLGDMENLDPGRRIRLEEDVDREEEEGMSKQAASGNTITTIGQIFS